MPPEPVDAHPLAAALDLEPHPEGGWYRRTWCSDVVIDEATGRRAGSAIVYLLAAGTSSAWHRVTDADELWLFHDGDALELSLSPDGQQAETVLLGPDVQAGQRPQVVVPTGWWQSAHAPRRHALVTCTVTPEFRFEGFEMAPPGWTPGADRP